MVKHTQTIRINSNCLSMFDHFVGLVLKGLRASKKILRLAFNFRKIDQNSRKLVPQKCIALG